MEKAALSSDSDSHDKRGRKMIFPRGRTWLLVAVLASVSIIGFMIYQTISSGSAVVVIESNPQSIVYIDGEQKGKTPFEYETKAREIIVKLVPESFSVPLSPFEANVRLTEGVKTIVRRDFGENTGRAFGQIISFEKSVGADANVIVISDPDGVPVSLNGETVGVTPLKQKVDPGEHTLSLSSAGYEEMSYKIRAVSGYTVTSIAELAGREPVEEAPAPEADLEINTTQEVAGTSNKVNTLTILNTPLGFLRVRDIASTAGEEVGRVSPGDTYEIIQHDEEVDWYEIKLQDDNTGWVSGEYVSISE